MRVVTLLELDDGISLDELMRVLGAQGLTVSVNKKTQRPRVSRMPAFISASVIETATAQAEHGVEHLPRRDLRIVEPLRHHTHSRNQLADFSVRRKS